MGKLKTGIGYDIKRSDEGEPPVNRESSACRKRSRHFMKYGDPLLENFTLGRRKRGGTKAKAQLSHWPRSLLTNIENFCKLSPNQYTLMKLCTNAL